ncbi:PREDICTED: NAD(P)H-quinone oxidoreductase subunit S, chloroplastic [Ipomoea nil]|uniref:NAD(P)H-quinone oxidoreductase subunit S, chloroplastic n=1 Tax=Ipomoea nil TaxID=35883 RepID=UPI000900B67D|nr:PREDICTED: NAD(P)H-quinone oxidoreductase subunit S, chloroplastic [Ipomoea nil]
MAAASFQLASLQVQGSPLQKSTFLGQTHISNLPLRPPPKPPASFALQTPVAKFNLFEVLGGRGLCNGEEGLEKELKKSVSEGPSSLTKKEKEEAAVAEEGFPEDAFGKELLGFTGGFPGGETGLQKFIEENPPPAASSSGGFDLRQVKKPKPPELPMLLPGMIAIVKNPESPYHMYCGIVQRITDGKAGVLFEGGNWDRLITFRLDELERREKGPPMVNPRSAILETMVEKSSEA